MFDQLEIKEELSLNPKTEFDLLKYVSDESYESPSPIMDKNKSLGRSQTLLNKNVCFSGTLSKTLKMSLTCGSNYDGALQELNIPNSM